MGEAIAIIADMGERCDEYGGSGNLIIKMADSLSNCPIQIIGGLTNEHGFENYPEGSISFSSVLPGGNSLEREEFREANVLLDMSGKPNLDLIREAAKKGLAIVVSSEGIWGKTDEKVLVDFAKIVPVVVVAPGYPQQMIDAADAVFRYEKIPGRIFRYSHWR